MITEVERREARMARRLWMVCGVDVFRGVTEHDQPKQRMRAAIIEKKLSAEIMGTVKDLGAITFEQAFELTYSEQLTQPGKVNAREPSAA